MTTIVGSQRPSHSDRHSSKNSGQSAISPSKRVYMKSVASRKATVTSLPHEILLKIFSLLSPSELLSAACVCQRWLELSKDNVIWRSVYQRYVSEPLIVDDSQIDELPASYWRDECVKCGIERRNKRVLKMLTKTNHYTKLPSNIQTCLKKADIRWQLCLVDSDGLEHTFQHNDLFYLDTSVSIRWYSLRFPPLNKTTKLRLYSLNPVFFSKEGHAYKNSPCQRSLLLATDVRWSQLSSVRPEVDDGPIICYVIAGSIVVAVWKDGGELAFVSTSLHYNKLVERCLLGTSDKLYQSPKHKPYFDDIDPKFGLHGYSCVIELRNQRNKLWSDGFSDLFTKELSANGIRLTAVSADDKVYHQTIHKQLNFPWKTDLFKGVCKNFCILDLTIQDEQGKLIWCLSVPVKVTSRDEAKTDFEFDGDDYYIHHISDRGHVYICITKDAESNGYNITNFYIQLATKTVNNWFGTKY